MRKLIESYNNGYGPGNGGNGNGAPGSGNNGGNGNNSNGGNGNGSPKRPSILMLILSGLMTVIVVLMLYNAFFGTNTGTEVSYTDFLKDLEADKVAAVEVNKESGMVTVQLKQEAAATPAPGSYVSFYGITQKVTQSQTVYYTMLMEDLDTLTARLQEHDVQGNRVTSNTSNFLMEILVTVVLPVVLIWIVAGFLFRRMGGSGGPMGVGKSNAKVYVQKETGVTFKDVAGEDEAKESLVEVVDFLHNPQKYSKIGAKLPKGALLVGPPGTGKTMLAKAVAGEANVPFFSMSGSEFVEMFVGMGASKVRDLFKQAKEKAPCIVFIDEIDAIGKKRDGQVGGNDEREQTLNQLLTEMDGFEGNNGVIILAATNRPESLDPALLRPGRFDRRVPVELPDLKGREEILKVHARKIKVADNVDFNKIARMASGASGAELANIVNEAALRAVRDGRKFATQADLEESIEVVIAGYQKKNAILTDKEKRIVAYHEIGHALVAAKQTNSAPVQKITIVPRTSGALGYTMQVEEEGNHYLMSKEEMENKIATLTGGRAAEEIAFGSVTTGASNDIEQATKLAKGMITRYGMSKRFGLVGLATVESQYLEGRTALNCSDETAAAIDEEVVAMIKESYDQALQMLRENRDLMDKLAAFLIERETITGKEFMEIFRREKGLPDPEEEKKDVTETNAAGSAVKGNSVDVTIGEQVMTSTDSTFQPLTFEDSLQEAKEQTAPAQDTAKQPAESAKEETSAQEKHEQESTEQKSDAAEESKDPKDPPQGPVGLFSHGTL